MRALENQLAPLSPLARYAICIDQKATSGSAAVGLQSSEAAQGAQHAMGQRAALDLQPPTAGPCAPCSERLPQRMLAPKVTETAALESADIRARPAWWLLVDKRE